MKHFATLRRPIQLLQHRTFSNQIYTGFQQQHLYRPDFRATTIVNVRKGDQVAMVGDGQISLGPTVFKNTARKLRKIQDGVICGFAGSAADCLTLLELLEKEFEKHPGQTLRACLSLAKQWRTSKSFVDICRQDSLNSLC